MRSSDSKKVQSKRELTIGLVFAEDANDAKALIELTNALWPDAPPIHHARSPLVLVRNRADAEARKNAAKISDAVKAFEIRKNAKAAIVIAHEDCDAVEPAHTPLAAKIKANLVAEGLSGVVPVAPAWEMEAWWFMWPDAVSAVNSKWKKLRSTKGNHGMITNAKESLRKALRTKEANDYEESDAPKIALKVRELNLVRNRQGTASSFNDFEREIDALKT